MLAGLAGIFIAIVAIILLSWKGWKLEWSMFTGALIVGIFSGLGPVEGIIILGNSLRDPVTVYLILVIIAITSFGNLLLQGNAGVAYMGIIFISSLAGYVASPFHLCLIFTVEHFKANLLQVLIKVSIACSFLVALGLVQFIIYTLS